MSKTKRILSMALSAVLGLSMMAGCKDSGTSSGGSSSGGSSGSGDSGNSGGGSSEGGSVYWLNFKPESDGVLQELATTYTNETGVQVKVVTAASGTYDQTLLAEMDKSNPPTLFVIGNAEGAEKWNDWALDLTGTAIANELNTDAYNIYSSAGKLVSIGYCFECFGIIVNPDLLVDAGYSLDDINNFESLKKVAEDIHSRSSELGFDAFTSNDMDSSSSWRYTGHMVNLEYYYEQNGTAWTECPATITGEYMEYFKNLYDLCVENSTVERTALATGGHDAAQEFNDKKAVFYVNGSWEWEGVKEAVPNATMIPYYCGVSGEENAGLNSGTENCWAINSKASEADQKATMDFLVWLVSDPDASRKAVDSFGAMPYKNAAESTNGFLAASDSYAADGCYVMNWATNYQPNVDAYREVIVSALNAYNANPSDDTWAQVKTAVVDGWATQYTAVNG